MRGFIVFTVAAALSFTVTECLTLRSDMRDLQRQIAALQKQHVADITGLARASQSNSAGIVSNTNAIKVLAGIK